MIGKIKKGKSFGGCIRYVMGKDNAEIIDSDGVLVAPQKRPEEVRVFFILRILLTLLKC